MKRRYQALVGAAALAAVLGTAYYDSELASPPAATVPARVEPPSVPPPSVPPPSEATVDAPAPPRVTHFRIGHRNVKSIYADTGAVWVATSDGLIRYDFATEKHELFDRKDGLASASVFFVGRANGHVLAGTAGGQLSVFDERARSWTSSAIPGAGAVLDLHETSAGEIWIASLAGVVQVPPGEIGNPDKWLRHTAESTQGGLPGHPVYAVAEGKRGEMWFATERGVARFANDRWDNWEFDAKAQRVLTVKVDARGRVWAGTWGKGLRRFDGRSWKAYSTAQGLPGDYVFALYGDRRGSLWIGTEKGVARMKDGKLEKKLHGADGLLADKALALATSSDGSLWVGSFGGVARIRAAGAL